MLPNLLLHTEIHASQFELSIASLFKSDKKHKSQMVQLTEKQAGVEKYAKAELSRYTKTISP